jgi:predicted PurR-regulated permease PerM
VNPLVPPSSFLLPEIDVANINLNAATRLGVNSLILLGGVLALYLGRAIFIPTIIALLLGAILWPAAVWLHHRLHFRWGVACMTVIAGLILLNLLITLGFALAIPQLLKVLPRVSAQDSEDQLQKVYSTFRNKFLKMNLPIDEDLFPERAEKSQPFMYVADTVTKYVPEGLLKISIYGIGYLWQWILILFLLLFLMLEGRMLIRRVVEIFGPSQEARNAAAKVLSDMAQQVRTYLLGKTLLNCAVALLLGFVYRWAGLSQPWTWAMLTAVLLYIPYIGPIVSIIPPFIDAFLSNESPMVALGVLLFYLVTSILNGYLVIPVVMGRSMALNATTVLLACMFWELVWGPSGLFLAMPLMAAIKSICYHVPGWRQWANLMSSTELEPEPVLVSASRPELDLGDSAALALSNAAESGLVAEGSKVKHV